MARDIFTLNGERSADNNENNGARNTIVENIDNNGYTCVRRNFGCGKRPKGLCFVEVMAYRLGITVTKNTKVPWYPKLYLNADGKKEVTLDGLGPMPLNQLIAYYCDICPFGDVYPTMVREIVAKQK